MKARFEIIVEQPEGVVPDLDAELDKLTKEFKNICGVTTVKVLVAIGDCIPTRGSLEDA
jgi:hypothetical protein